MNLLIYSPRTDRDETELLRITCAYDVRVVRTAEELIMRLSKPPDDHGTSAVILLISGMADLEKFGEARDCFSDAALIVIIPEEESVLLPIVFHLRATYTGFRGGLFEDVAAVIARIQTRLVRTKHIDPHELEERL